MTWRLVKVEPYMAGSYDLKTGVLNPMRKSLALIFESEDLGGMRTRRVVFDPSSGDTIYPDHAVERSFDHDEMIRNMTDEERARVMVEAVRWMR